MRTLNHKEQEQNDDKMLHEVYITRKILFQPFDTRQLKKESENFQNKTLCSDILTEAHIIALIKGGLS